MTKEQIEEEAIKYCSRIDFTNNTSLNEKGKQLVTEWCKQDFIAGANWMLNAVLPQAHVIKSVCPNCKFEPMINVDGKYKCEMCDYDEGQIVL